MRILAIDTSNDVMGIALLDHQKVAGEYITNLKKNHSIRIMPAIDTLMKECGFEPKDLSRIAVAKGPGSYTGVRIGVTIAKTLAWSLNIPLVGVSSLEVLAASVSRYFNGYVSPLFDARRGQIYTGLYEHQESRIRSVMKDQIILADEWARQVKEHGQRILFVGNDLSLHESAIKAALGELAVFAAPSELNPRPGELALLAADREPENVHAFVPNYIRLAEAEAKWLDANRNQSADF